ncbi:MAG: hypothetical protein FD152_4260, partial [Xanthobacteraceae bacterium]
DAGDAAAQRLARVLSVLLIQSVNRCTHGPLSPGRGGRRHSKSTGPRQQDQAAGLSSS